MWRWSRGGGLWTGGGGRFRERRGGGERGTRSWLVPGRWSVPVTVDLNGRYRPLLHRTWKVVCALSLPMSLDTADLMRSTCWLGGPPRETQRRRDRWCETGGGRMVAHGCRRWLECPPILRHKQAVTLLRHTDSSASCQGPSLCLPYVAAEAMAPCPVISASCALRMASTSMGIEASARLQHTRTVSTARPSSALSSPS